MTLKEYLQSQPQERIKRAADDLSEAAKIEQEHAALPNAIFDSADQIDDMGFDKPATPTADDPQEDLAPQSPQQSFDLSDEEESKKFIKGMELSHPELVNRLRRDETAWDEMLTLDRQYAERMQRDSGIKFTGDDKSDNDFFRWAYGRGYLESDTSFGSLASAFGRGLWQMAKGAGKLGATAVKSAVNPTAGVELAATAVDAAQAAVSEYQQLGAGLAALTAGDNPQVKMEAMYALAKFSDSEKKTHNSWRKAIDDSFAEVPVDEDSVEFLSEAFDVSNLVGAGAGKMVTRGLKRAGASGAAEMLGKSRTMFGSEAIANVVAKVPLLGTAEKRAILVGQADELSKHAEDAYAEVAASQAKLAAIRATLANNPTWSNKDILLKQIGEAEKVVAAKQASFDAAKAQLDTTRQAVTDALNLEGRGLLNLATAGALEAAGTAVRGTGRTLTRAYRGASEAITGEAENAAFDMAAGQAVGNVVGKGNLITRMGQDMIAAGRTLSQAEASIPYFRRLRQAGDATKLTRGAAAFIDWSHLGWVADKTGDLAKAAAAGAPVSGAFGYVASGGDLAAAAESAGAGAAYGIGGGAYGQWQAYTDPRFRYEELLANRRQFRDTLSTREVGGSSQLQIFDQMDAGDQVALASYAQGAPDVAFRFIYEEGGPSGHYDRENNFVVINTWSSSPIADIFRHEVAHFVERHGLETQVRELYLGDADKGVVGQFTELDKLGNPVLVETTTKDGEKKYSYKLNAQGEKLKAEYEKLIQNSDPAFKMSDEYFSSELFAEQYADRLFRGGFRRDLSRNAIDNVVDALANKPLLKDFMGRIGLVFDGDDRVVGTNVFSGFKKNAEVEKLITSWNSEKAKGAKSEIVEKEDAVLTERDLRDPSVAAKWLQGGGAMRFGPDGKPVYDSNGTPQFLTEKEADAIQRDLANELISEIEKYVADNPADNDLIQRREIVDVNGVKRTVYSGRRIPISVIDALEKQKRFNPHQLAHLRAASASVEKHGVGAMIAHFYQAKMRKLGGRAYKTVAGRWRRDGVVGFQITKDGNVLINSVSWEQLDENAKKAAKTKLARELYSTSGVPIEAAITADVKTYLTNLVDGKPGDTEIGEARRDFINNLLGIRMASNADANPLYETTSAPKIILTNLRLDNINRMSPLDFVAYAWGPQQYRQAKKNARPETDGADVMSRPDSRQTESPEFKSWFGDSKVVDEQGKPLVVYHGASSDFTEFRGRNGWNYLSDSRKFAEKFDAGGGLKELFASIKNPLDLTGVPARKVGVNKLVSVLNEAGIDMTSADFPFYGRDLYQILNTDSVQKTLRSKAMAAGYDGIKFPDFYDSKNRGTSYVAFDSTQIKSATGNRGTFDPENPNIQYRPDAHGRGIVNRGEDSLQFRPEGNDQTTRVAADYVKKAFGRDYDPHTTYDEAPEDRLKEIADYFQNVAKHEPDAPEVLRSYRAMARETIEQYNAMIAAGIKPEPYRGKGEPYASSEEMMRDVRENKHLYFLRTDNAFGQGTQDAANPLLEKSGIKIGDFELLVNDVFRVVHDYFGHTQQGLQFGPRGEFNAWKSHSRMYSDEAQGAVAAETLAQNAWVNFGAHLRREDGSIPKKGEPDYVPPQDRPFGEQKNFLVPAEMMQFRPESADTQYRPEEKSRPISEVGDQKFTVTTKKGGTVTMTVAERYADQMVHAEALPLEFSVNSKGNVKTDDKGPKVATRDYNFYESPVVAALNIDPEVLQSIKTKLNTTTLGQVKAGYIQSALTADEQAALTSMVNAYSDRAIADFRRYAADPDVKAAAGWYSDIAEFFKQLIPDQSDRTKFLEFLGGTSPNTSVEQNFLYALDLFNRWKKGELDGLLNSYRRVLNEFDADVGEYAELKPVLLKSGKQAIKDGQPLSEWVFKPGAEEQFRNDYFEAMVADGIPRADARKESRAEFKEEMFWTLFNLRNGVKLERAGEGGGKYGVHTDRILQILDGVWREQTDAPKAPNFTENLAALSTRATIDVWAARWLRRLGHDGLSPVWRILPMAEQGVSNSDFFLGQEIFAETTKRINEQFAETLGRTIGADDLQAIMWFAEKREWRRRGWADIEDLGDFRQYAYALKPQPDGTFILNNVTLNSTSINFLKTLSGVVVEGATLKGRDTAMLKQMREARDAQIKQAMKEDKLSPVSMAAAERKYLAAQAIRGQKVSTKDYRGQP